MRVFASFHGLFHAGSGTLLFSLPQSIGLLGKIVGEVQTAQCLPCQLPRPNVGLSSERPVLPGYSFIFWVLCFGTAGLRSSQFKI